MLLRTINILEWGEMSSSCDWVCTKVRPKTILMLMSNWSVKNWRFRWVWWNMTPIGRRAHPSKWHEGTKTCPMNEGVGWDVTCMAHTHPRVCRWAFPKLACTNQDATTYRLGWWHVEQKMTCDGVEGELTHEGFMRRALCLHSEVARADTNFGRRTSQVSWALWEVSVVKGHTPCKGEFIYK